MKDLFDTEDPLDRVMRIAGTLKKRRQLIEEALSHGQNANSFEHICKRVFEGSLDLYDLENSIILMETVQYSNFSVYHGVIAGGDLEEILNFQHSLIRESKLRDCKFLTITGRLGWVPVLKKRGWRHDLSYLSIEVD